MQHNGISALTLAIVLGIVVGNTLYPRIAAGSAAGVGFSKQILLRAGIILYGLRLTFQDIAGVGLHGVLLDALMLASTFGLACLLGTRLFGLDRTTTLLIGAGSSICGAAAVMATEPVVRGRAEQVAVAVSTVVVFGTLGIFLYPALFQLDQDWGLLPRDPGTWGVYIGATVHEVAQVVAAGRSIGIEAADTAVIAKMVRVMMLAPFLILLSAWLARDKAHRRQHSGATKITIPWFAVGFVLVAGLNSLVSLPPALVSHVNDLDTFLLAMAMAASASARTSRRSAAPASSRCCWPPCYSPGWCSAVDYSPAWRSPESSARKPCTARRKASCRASTSSMPWPRRQPWTSPLPG